MNFFTHIALSRIIYNRFESQIPLDKVSFIYGNIKPDITNKLMENSHILDNYLIFVCNSADQIISREMSPKEFSVELGQICHYVCDFFCRYHLNKEIFNHLKDHFFYELKLHFALKKLSKEEKAEISTQNKIVRRDIASIIFEMRKDYLSDPLTAKKDIDYAISTSIWVCESVSYFLSQSIPQTETQLDFYVAMPLAGGQ